METTNILEHSKIEDKINTLIGSAKDKRLDHITKLTEANKIAHSMGIKDPIDYKLKKISDSSTTKSQIMTDISNNSGNLYTMGYEALEAEIASLTKPRIKLNNAERQITKITTTSTTVMRTTSVYLKLALYAFVRWLKTLPHLNSSSKSFQPKSSPPTGKRYG